MPKKIALLHRYPEAKIKETNAAFPYLKAKGMDVLTFKKFDRLSCWSKFWKSFAWIFYAPFLVLGKGYDVIYCDDSYPFYPALVKLFSPLSKVVIRLGDFHLMYNYSGIIYSFLHFFEKITWSVVDERIAISDEMANHIRKEILAKVHVVKDPVDPKDFPYLWRENHGTVMFHGVLVKNKNVDMMLEAAERLPDVMFVIVGDGPDRKRLEEKAPHNVFFKGWVPFFKVRKFIQSCAIGLALRSNNPGNEFVVTSPFLQYGIMGKPCLVTKRRVYRNYEWQFSTVDEMVEKIKILLTKPEEGIKLRDYVLAHHQAEDIADRIWQILT